MILKELQLFKFSESEVKVLVIDNQPWFIAKDIAEILEYARPDNMHRFIDTDCKRKINPQDFGIASDDQSFRMTLINESGVYQAIFGSRSEKAKYFRRWISRRVLPEIRKTGSFLSQETKLRILELEEENAKLKKEQFLLTTTINNKIVNFENQKAVTNDKITFLENQNQKLTIENNQLQESVKNNDLRMTSLMPGKWVIKDIRLFMREYTKEVIGINTSCDLLYDTYLKSRRHRNDLPNKFVFESAVFQLPMFKILADKEYWRDLKLI